MKEFTAAKLALFGNPNIGVYIHVTDEYAFVPPGLRRSDLDLISEVLGVEVVETTIAQSRLLGIMLAGNNSGLILPRNIEEVELDGIRRRVRDMNILVLKSRNNAVGNLIVANDKAAMVYPFIEEHLLKEISDVLGVEVIPSTIAGVPTVGSVLVVTRRGGLVHPDTQEQELGKLSEIFKVPIVTGTVNFGVSFVRTGLVANARGALAGDDTTGPELARIQMALGGM